MKETKIVRTRKPAVINGDIAIKPYYYMRNGLLHTRFTVDRCVYLSKEEEQRIKNELAGKPEQKQEILGKNWNLLTVMVGKPIISDGVMEGARVTKKLSERFAKNGCKS